MNKVKLNEALERYLVLFLILILSGCAFEDENDYLNTSNVNYNEQKIKLLAIDFVGNKYLKSYEIKISINIPISKKLIQQDSIQIKNYVDSIFLSLKIKEHSSIHFSVFNETNYTNKCFIEKKGLLFCDFSPCIMSYGYIYDPEVSQ